MKDVADLITAAQLVLCVVVMRLMERQHSSSACRYLFRQNCLALCEKEP